MITEFIINELRQYISFPVYVSTNPDDYNNVKTAAFADITHQDYPCNTKSNTFLSCARYYYNTIIKKSQQNPIIERKLEKYIDFWNIKPDVQIIKEALKKAIQPKKANYILPQFNKYPVTTPEQREETIKQFLNERNTLPFDIRYKVACELKDTRHPAILKSAMIGIYDNDSIAIAIERRAYAIGTKNFELSNGLKKLAKIIKDSKEKINKDQFIKLARVMDWFDTEFNYPVNFEDEAIKFTEHDINEIKDNLIKIGEYEYLKEDLQKIYDILYSLTDLIKSAVFDIKPDLKEIINNINKSKDKIILAHRILYDKNIKPIEIK